jgi:hypothetical protein
MPPISGGMALPAVIRDDATGFEARTSTHMSVGRAKRNRAVIVSFDDLGVVVAMSPAAARRLAGELSAEAALLAQ